MGPKYKKILIISSIIIGCILFSYLAGYLLSCIIHHGVIILDMVLLIDNTTLLYALEIFMLILLTALILYLRHETLYSHKNVIEGKSRDKHISANLEESRWQSNAEIKSNYTYLSFNELKYNDVEGIPLSAEYRKGKLSISLAKPIHTLVIGTTEMVFLNYLI